MFSLAALLWICPAWELHAWTKTSVSIRRKIQCTLKPFNTENTMRASTRRLRKDFWVNDKWTQRVHDNHNGLSSTEICGWSSLYCWLGSAFYLRGIHCSISRFRSKQPALLAGRLKRNPYLSLFSFCHAEVFSLPERNWETTLQSIFKSCVEKLHSLPFFFRHEHTVHKGQSDFPVVKCSNKKLCVLWLFCRKGESIEHNSKNDQTTLFWLSLKTECFLCKLQICSQ